MSATGLRPRKDDSRTCSVLSRRGNLKSGASAPIAGARVSRSARNCVIAARRSGSIPPMNAIIRLKSVSDRFFLSRSMKVSKPISHLTRRALRLEHFAKSARKPARAWRTGLRSPHRSRRPPLRSGQQTGALPGRLLRGWVGCKDASEHQSDGLRKEEYVGILRVEQFVN